MRASPAHAKLPGGRSGLDYVGQLVSLVADGTGGEAGPASAAALRAIGLLCRAGELDFMPVYRLLQSRLAGGLRGRCVAASEPVAAALLELLGTFGEEYVDFVQHEEQVARHKGDDQPEDDPPAAKKKDGEAAGPSEERLEYDAALAEICGCGLSPVLPRPLVTETLPFACAFTASRH